MGLSLEEKIRQLLAASGSTVSEANELKDKLDGEREDLGSEEDGKKASASAKKTKFPGNDKGVEMTQDKQGDPDTMIGSEVQELGSEEAGKTASGKASYAGGLKDKGGAEDAAKDFKTVVDPTKVVNKTSSKGNVDGIHLESVDLSPIFGDSDLSEEFKDKATSLFEAVVQARVNHEFEALQEQYETELQEEVDEIKAGLVEKVDIFLDKVVEAWISENQLAVESGIRTEIAENFITGLKNLFAESYIEVPEEKFDVLADLEEQVQTLQAQVQEQADTLDSLAGENDQMKKAAVFESMTAGLATTEVEKLKSLVEGVLFESEEMYQEKIRVIKENYFPKTQKVGAEKALLEAAIGDGNFNGDSSIERYAQAISRSARK